MKRNFARVGAALLLLMFGIALAQPYVDENWGLTPISNGVNSTHTAAQELVITNDTAYATFFGGSPPTSPTVNFATEDVLAVTMGTQPAGSSINITGLDIRTTGFTAGWGFVHVTSVVGSGGGAGTITFSGATVTNTGGATQNTGGTTVVEGGTFTIGTVMVGGVPMIQFKFTGGTTTITGGTTTTTGGTTTASLPSGTITNIGGTTTTIGDTTTTTSPVTVTGGTATSTLPITIKGGTTTISGDIMTIGGTTTITGGTTTGGTVEPYSVVKVAKGALTYAFINDVTTTPYSGPTPFNEVCYSTGGGAAPFTEKIMIDGSGNVTVNRSRTGTGGTNYVGTLDLTESQALNTAFVNANPASLPGTIVDVATTSLTGIPSETLSSTIGSGVYTSVIARAGFYGGSSTMKSLIDAIRAPAERIVRGTQSQRFQGHVHYVGNDLQVGGSIIAPTDPFYELIATVVGNHVTFDGLGKPGPKGNPVVDVAGKLTVDQPLLSFPSAGADVISTLAAGTPLDVTNLTLFGNYFEVASSGQRGFVPADLILIIRPRVIRAP